MCQPNSQFAHVKSRLILRADRKVAYSQATPWQSTDTLHTFRRPISSCTTGQVPLWDCPWFVRSALSQSHDLGSTSNTAAHANRTLPTLSPRYTHYSAAPAMQRTLQRVALTDSTPKHGANAIEDRPGRHGLAAGCSSKRRLTQAQCVCKKGTSAAHLK